MRTVIASLESIAVYSQSRNYSREFPKLPKELDKDYEERTWKERVHYDKDGHVFIPPMSFKNCLSEAARYLSNKIPGKQNATYTKHFEAGVLVTEGITLPVTRETLQGQWLNVPSDGRRGGSKRVWKCFPVIPEWSGAVLFYVFDETITQDVFEYHLMQAGSFIGIGRFRPRNNGFYGRFKSVNFLWEEKEMAA